MYEYGERMLSYGLAIAAGFVICLMATDVEASIVNDPAALEAKLEEMQAVRMAKHKAKEAYWEDYRRNQEAYQDVRCTRVYTTQGTFRKCRTITNYRYTGDMKL